MDWGPGCCDAMEIVIPCFYAMWRRGCIGDNARNRPVEVRADEKEKVGEARKWYEQGTDTWQNMHYCG